MGLDLILATAPALLRALRAPFRVPSQSSHDARVLGISPFILLSEIGSLPLEPWPDDYAPPARNLTTHL